MIRQVIVSTAVLYGLFAAGDAAAKNPNMPNISKIVVPRLPATTRVLTLQRRIAARDLDLGADTADTSKAKKKKKKTAARNLKRSKGLVVSKKELPVSDRLRDAAVVFGGNVGAIAELKEILEGLEDGDNGAFGGPLSTLFPGHETANPKPNIPGTGGHTTGQHEGTSNPGDRLEEIIATFAGRAGSGDNRGPDEGQSEKDPGTLNGHDRSNSVGGMGVGGFDSGLPDPSGQASQDDPPRGWASCGSGCTFRLTEIRRGGRVVAHREERRDETGSTTNTTDSEGTTVTRFRSGHWAFASYRSVSDLSSDGTQRIEVRDYINPRMEDVIITWVVGADGGWVERSQEPIPEVRQPAPEGTATGGGPRGGAFYRLVCGGLVCTYTPLSRENVVVSFAPIQVNPGSVDNDGAGNADSGPRVGPRAVTDPDPENLGVGSGSSRPIGRGCGGGMVRC